MNDAALTLMVFGPAFFGVVALVVGIKLLRKPAGARADRTVRTVIGILCLTFTLGIGACYGLMMFQW